MEFGVHLPVLALDDRQFSVERLVAVAVAADRSGFAALSTNDHLVFSRPWLDGPVALASVLGRTGRMALFTTIALPVIRTPVLLAKTLAAIDVLSGGRLVVGIGPGSSQADYQAVDIPWEERWKRLEESVHALRSLWNPDADPFDGKFYSTTGTHMLPHPEQRPPPIWIGSWGSDAGLRRVARLADGWLASGYNTDPAAFAEARFRLGGHLESAGKDPEQFPNALATVFFHVTEDQSEARSIIDDVLAPALRRDPDDLRRRLLIGSASLCAERLDQYRAAGVQRVFLWPVRDEAEQVARFRERVDPG